MGSNKAKRHVHKYEKVIMNGDKIWRCARADCGHYMPKHQEVLVIGKNTECWSCGDTMELNASNMHMDRPQCYDCQLGIIKKNTEEIKIPDNINLDDLLGNK